MTQPENRGKTAKDSGCGSGVEDVPRMADTGYEPTDNKDRPH